MILDNQFVICHANKTITSFGFSDIQNNQGLGKCYQPKLKTEADITYTSPLIILDLTN